MNLTETLTWKPASELPDSDTTVHLFDPTASEPVWPGYHNGERWLYVDGMPATPTHYSEMPGGPNSRASDRDVLVAAGHFKRDKTGAWHEVPKGLSNLPDVVILFHSPDWRKS